MKSLARTTVWFPLSVTTSEASDSTESGSSRSERRTILNVGPPAAPATPARSAPDSGQLRCRGPGEYVRGTSWATWEQIFENVMAIRQVTDERYKTLMLVTEIGTAAYSELRTMLRDVKT
ncbi:hypothetical protein L596_027448 [Steinernema carpocapsae]|uniref:Uncharacterized protein n=1 Tax=Steinernema carpocapsae TaxID=34508 RepID=A0A4U5LVH5_STECR|nr:hypothetical protein L596_027448 [Steinernema carpocapsae]